LDSSFKELIERELRIAQGTIICAQNLLTQSFFNMQEGHIMLIPLMVKLFCLLNDQAIAAQFYWTINSQKILIIDLDVHQGNGTAEIFAKNPNVFTFSTHGKTNYPFKKETSDLDIAFDDNTSDDEFLKIISAVIPKLIEAQNPISSFI
jgi:hypothetical protein